MTSVFTKHQSKNYPYRFKGSLHVFVIAGGVPTDQKKVEGWLRTKFADSDDLIRAKAAEIMVERGVDLEAATDEVIKLSHLNGFRRDPERGLYIMGYQLKAALKEAASVAANEGRLTTKKWGNPDNANYEKGLKGWFPEHVFVEDHRLYLGVDEPTGVAQRFPHTRHGSGIQYEEYVEGATIDFTIETDHDFAEAEWAAIWLAGERLGIGATRSQGYGRYEVTRWEQID